MTFSPMSSQPLNVKAGFVQRNAVGQREDAATLPIIVLTVDAFDDDVQKDREAVMSAHVSNPIDPGVLESVLSEEIRKVQNHR